MRFRLTFVTLLAALLACTLTPPGTPGNVEAELQTRVAATLTALAVTPSTPATAVLTETPAAPPTATALVPTVPNVPTVLPYPLLFLADRTGSLQVWRIDVDGATLAQITDEPAPVTAFDASPADGALAFVSGNQLILADRNGDSRQVLVTGAELPPTPDSSYWAQEITAPVWSPGGDKLAYALNGVTVLTLGTGASLALVSNILPTDEDPASIRIYRPKLWSPDGSRLLAEVSFYEAGSLVILPAEGGPPLSTSIPSGIVCCQPAWTSDGTAILIANDSIGLLTPGLHRIDAATGVGVTLIPGDEGGTFNFVGWPKPLNDGRLLYFFGQTQTFPERGTWPASMYVSEADGVTGRAQLRTDSYIAAEVLWAPDGGLAVITDVTEFTSVYPPQGPLRALPAFDTPAIGLADAVGRNLRWGR